MAKVKRRSCGGTRRTRSRKQKTYKRRKSFRLKKFIGGAGHTVDLVIARYKENLDWLSNFKDYKFHKVYIYNKSDLPVDCAKLPITADSCEVIQLPNVGTCDFPYLTHFSRQYDNLADVTVVAPGSAYLDYKMIRLKATVRKAFETGTTAIYGRKHDRPIKEVYRDFKVDKWITSAVENQEPGETYEHAPAAIRPFGAWYEAHFPGEASKFEGSVGIFAVSRADVHHSPKETYESLAKEVGSHRFHEALHFIERSWPTLFDPLAEGTFMDVSEL